ncbi:DUF4235 domain-containing protein [Knoellia subterranea]|uniref:DUF4235 domain-containing protein n=1 Tax=Knoellia subterranea KCTC 19937 TaxID=1385521 RepID=A0A0A0JQQ1_9MICO|nr:DUF4235 domain-containing protein [Knoellia subterranea]KGN37916.1 hypothetical protein N803_12710 [Knoellia subterranea KCTC 19937]
MGSAVWKILGTGSAVLAGIAATKVADQIWQKAGQDKGFDPKDPDSPFVTALAYAALTGLAAGVARTMATRKAAQYYARSAGHKPHEITDRDL